MLLIIFFSSLILVCSFWKLYHRNNSELPSNNELRDYVDHSIQPLSGIDYKEEAEKVAQLALNNHQAETLAIFNWFEELDMGMKV